MVYKTLSNYILGLQLHGLAKQKRSSQNNQIQNLLVNSIAQSASGILSKSIYELYSRQGYGSFCHIGKILVRCISRYD